MLIAISGGAGSGKTETLNKLIKLGYNVIPEAALQVIDDLNADLGIEGQKAWRKRNYSEFQKRIYLKQIELESDLDQNKLYFLDRTGIDGFTYCRFYKQNFPQGYLETLRKGVFQYDVAFVLETISPFPLREGSGRTSTEDVSRILGKMLFEDYERRFQIPTYWIGMDSVENRVIKIVSKVLESRF